MPPTPDAELVRRCLADDESAWAALTARYADMVFGIARRYELPADAAADVVQEVFLALLKNLGRLRNSERLVGWLARAARRESWRQVRRGRSRRRREESVARRDDGGGSPPPDELAEHEVRQTVREAYAAIGERCRRLLDALFLESTEASYGDVAGLLGLAVGSIGSLRRRCLDELRTELERLGVRP